MNNIPNENKELLTEFKEIYPEVNIDTIPDQVWEQVKNGIPLAAAYAIFEKKQSINNQKAQDVNSQNSTKSPGKIQNDGGEEKYFTNEQIRKMSASEVRKHYNQIIRSMSNTKFNS